MAANHTLLTFAFTLESVEQVAGLGLLGMASQGMAAAVAWGHPQPAGTVTMPSIPAVSLPLSCHLQLAALALASGLAWVSWWGVSPGLAA